MEQFKNHLRELIADNDFSRVLKELFAQDLPQEVMDDLVLIQSQLNDNKEAQRQNIARRDDLIKEKNRIVKGLLQIIDGLEIIKETLPTDSIPKIYLEGIKNHKKENEKLCFKKPEYFVPIVAALIGGFFLILGNYQTFWLNSPKIEEPIVPDTLEVKEKIKVIILDAYTLEKPKFSLKENPKLVIESGDSLWSSNIIDGEAELVWNEFLGNKTKIHLLNSKLFEIYKNDTLFSFQLNRSNLIHVVKKGKKTKTITTSPPKSS